MTIIELPPAAAMIHLGLTDPDLTSPTRPPVHPPSAPTPRPVPHPTPTPPRPLPDLPVESIPTVTELIEEDIPSSVVTTAVEDLKLAVLDRVTFDLQHGTATVRTAIARTLLPSILKAQSAAEDDDGLDILRLEMQRMNEEMLGIRPSIETHSLTPDTVPEL